MRIAVMAAGAVGGYFGARMAAAGHDVAFIARGAHRDAIRRDGLKIESALGDLHLKDVDVTDDPKQVGPVDVVLFAVKLWDTETAGEQARPLVGSGTRVITLQNGVDSVERLAPILGHDATIGGATFVVAKIAQPGVIRHTGTMARVRCGRLDRRPDAVLAGYVEQIKAASIDITLADDMLLDLWKKFVLLSGTSGITATTRQNSRGRPRRRGHAGVLLQADARDDCRRRRGRRRFPARLRGGAGWLGGGLCAGDESLDGQRPRGGQSPRAGLARRQSGRARTQARHTDAQP